MKFLWAILLAPLAACSIDDADPEPVAQSTQVAGLTQTEGVIWAHHRLGESTATVHAQFVRARGVDAATALGALDIWRPDTDLALDACQVQHPMVFDASEGAHIEMLDAGTLTVGAGFGVARIETRQLPDFGQVSGVIYANLQGYGLPPVDVPFAEGETYIWQASGAEIGPLSVEIVAPKIPVILASDVSDFTKQVPWSADLELEWEAGQSESQLYLDLEGEGVTITCRLEDDGTFALGPALIEPLKATGAGASATLRRVATVPVTVPGVDRAELVFAAADSLFLFW